MKKVLEISVNGEFKQYLMRSEAHYISKMCEAWKVVTVRLVEISTAQYKIKFGK